MSPKIQDIDISIPLSNYAVSSNWETKNYSATTNYGNTTVLSYKIRISSCDPHFQGKGCDTCDVGWDIGANCTSCADNYYPDGVCKVHCIPTPEMSACDNQGKLVCKPHVEPPNTCESCEVGWDIGTNCTSCADNYYPAGICSVQCLSNENFACTAQGVRLCTIGSTAEECVSQHNLVGEAILGGMISSLAVAVLTGFVGLIVATIKRMRTDTAAEPIVHYNPTVEVREEKVELGNPATQQEHEYEYAGMNDVQMRPIIPESGVYNDEYVETTDGIKKPIIPEPGVYND